MEISLRRVSSLTQNEQQKMANYLKINNINLTLQSQCYWPSKSMLLAFKVNTISLQSQCYWPSKSMLLALKVNVIGTEEQKAMCHEGKTQTILPYTVISAEPMQRWCCSS